ncbi:MAG: CDP-alcohol phosphatidyltransferase family protein [candidate division KSB1 bacterium]|nr:CDP-alcohol phosphatidyltransferase family protein [candidate division KSB1 bacterium]MDZ7333560.1 CDP-alcohol phosphatidyltransferase family protein [candidate division KSB1 bacterium]MDZ7357005.1 CDP-alcohol phosphatidyltransferase family protein [candidate division KSB1 bacterium]MDZ7398674.1 CDP-alcohol phosphatidyltransferase family protein [candidate division KSB1 bacterium]
MNHRQSARFWTIPNLLSIFRILLVFPIAYFVWKDHLRPVIILALVSIASDYLDGIIARRYHQISEWGKLLDPLADKLAIAVILIVLYFKQNVPLWLVGIVIGRDVAIAILGLFLASKFKYVAASNMTGKVTANVLALMVVSYIFNLELFEKILTIAAIIMIFISSYSYLKYFITMLKQAPGSNSVSS